MKIRSILISILLVLGFVAPASAGQLADYGGSKVNVPTPDGWPTAGDAPLVMAASPAKDAVILYAVSEAADLGKAIKGLEGILSKHVTKIKLGKNAKGQVNGMNALMAKGKGKGTEGKDLGIAVVILETPSKKALIVVAVVEAAKKDAYKPLFEQLINGIKPM